MVTTLQEAESFVDFALDEEGNELYRGVEAGRIRHISQVSKRKGFCFSYWQNDEFDLAAEKNPNGRKYGYYAGNMCTRAAYCEMLSYFGIDLTPVAMSSLMHERNVENPYDTVTELIDGLNRTEAKSYLEFDEMFERYQQDEHYSPILLYMINKDTAVMHTVLVLGVQEDGRFICLDSAYHPVGGKPMWVFNMKLAANRSFVRYSMSDQYENLRIRACYQWYYDPDATETMQPSVEAEPVE